MVQCVLKNSLHFINLYFGIMQQIEARTIKGQGNERAHLLLSPNQNLLHLYTSMKKLVCKYAHGLCSDRHEDNLCKDCT